jgi:mannonate dehydratase
MPRVSRRNILTSAVPVAAALAGATAQSKAQSASTQPTAPARARMVLGCQRAPTDDRALMFFKRHAVEHICGYPAAEQERSSWTTEALSKLKDHCEAHGVTLEMVQFPFMSSAPIDNSPRKAVMSGREPERQREIDEACEIVRTCRAVGIPAIKYNFNLLGVLRTAPTEGRGGSRYSTWRLAEAQSDAPLTAAGPVPADVAWERITYFLERVVRVAEEYRVRLACHPHDPGVPDRGYRGVARVLGTVDGLRRFVEIRPSAYHGLNFCVGSVAEMLQHPADEIHDVIRDFGRRGKIFNVHFRNIRGRRDAFQEVFPDEGDLDMVRVMRTLKEVGYSYMVMPDHMPTHPDDPGGHQAFAFGYGYIKAMIQAVDAM